MARSGVKGIEWEARGESSPPLGAGAIGTPGLGQHCASLCPLPAQPRDLLVPSHAVRTLPGAGEQGKRVLLLHWGVSVPSKAFQMYGKALQVWSSSGVERRFTQACKITLGHRWLRRLF